jgi:hypothetical protein
MTARRSASRLLLDARDGLAFTGGLVALAVGVVTAEIYVLGFALALIGLPTMSQIDGARQQTEAERAAKRKRAALRESVLMPLGERWPTVVQQQEAREEIRRADPALAAVLDEIVPVGIPAAVIEETAAAAAEIAAEKAATERLERQAHADGRLPAPKRGKREPFVRTPLRGTARAQLATVVEDMERLQARCVSTDRPGEVEMTADDHAAYRALMADAGALKDEVERQERVKREEQRRQHAYQQRQRDAYLGVYGNAAGAVGRGARWDLQERQRAQMERERLAGRFEGDHVRDEVAAGLLRLHEARALSAEHTKRVQQWQREHGLPADGILGEKTRLAMTAALEGAEAVIESVEGEAVDDLLDDLFGQQPETIQIRDGVPHRPVVEVRDPDSGEHLGDVDVPPDHPEVMWKPVRLHEAGLIAADELRDTIFEENRRAIAEEQRLAFQISCDHTWSEIRSHGDVVPLRRFCTDCGATQERRID